MAAPRCAGHGTHVRTQPAAILGVMGARRVRAQPPHPAEQEPGLWEPRQLPLPRLRLPARPPSSSHSCLEETARPPGGRPFLSASSFPHSGTGLPAGPRVHPSATSASISSPVKEVRWQCQPEGSQEHETKTQSALTLRGAGCWEWQPIHHPGTYGPHGPPQTACSWADHKGQGAEGVQGPSCTSPVPQAISLAEPCVL